MANHMEDLKVGDKICTRSPISEQYYIYTVVRLTKTLVFTKSREREYTLKRNELWRYTFITPEVLEKIKLSRLQWKFNCHLTSLLKNYKNVPADVMESLMDTSKDYTKEDSDGEKS
jgi:hypothetical protein